MKKNGSNDGRRKVMKRAEKFEPGITCNSSAF